MRFPLLAARLALAALVLAALIAALAIGSVRGGLAGFATGLEMMTASVALGADRAAPGVGLDDFGALKPTRAQASGPA